jgi:hypothetical protein
MFGNSVTLDLYGIEDLVITAGGTGLSRSTDVKKHFRLKKKF